MQNNQADAELVINDLLNQLARLSKEKAIATALVAQYKKELDEIKSAKK
ncbi:MAG TPA: hypothetical protein VFX18_03930 [Candidatus Nitrosocosmicus sp.]|nr:hypothetical protein [Candidatus Nitrosocosmicus sp.]